MAPEWRRQPVSVAKCSLIHKSHTWPSAASSFTLASGNNLADFGNIGWSTMTNTPPETHTASTVGHTPTPWRWTSDGKVREKQTDDVIAQPGRNFALITPTPTLQANAAFIVTAVNNFDDMVVVLRHIDALALMARNGANFADPHTMTLENVAEDARAILDRIGETATCTHCEREITKSHDGPWVDPLATGDDSVWRETCDSHDTFIADHEPRL